MTFKIVTWNVNSVKARLDHLISLIEKHDPDIICLQELKCETDKFPYDELSHLPYNFYVHGQKSYNGVAILSKINADEVVTTFDENSLQNEARFIEASFSTIIGYVRIISLYAPNGGQVGEERYYKKLEFYDKLTNYLVKKISFDEKIFIGSDYNIAPFDIDVHDPNYLRNTTCFTYPEQEKLRTLLNSGFVDNFRSLYPDKQEFSWWDYRAGNFQQNKGMRIDSILSSANGVDYLSECIIDYDFRTKNKPSDHAPIVAIYEPSL
ncbi:MAG TPA: exodeoxyribonuclease III [Candidatus Megaira endosymbiont of Nemacystus decipiens]|nr:exodeoxyribonuclease III [Candidatus Megaera endosymbiont of Nemacystus decipiens]